MKEKLLYFITAFGSWIKRKVSTLPNDVQSILIVKQDEIGDMVTSLHVFKHLNSNYPHAQIDLICNKVNVPLFKYMPYVRCYQSIPEGRKYDLQIDLRGDFRSFLHGLRASRIYLCRGTIRFRNKMNGGQTNELVTNYEIIKPVLRTNFDEFDQSLIWSDKESISVKEWLQSNVKEPYVVMHLGARDKSRRWPVERFAEVIKQLKENHGLTSVLAGGPSDIEINKECISICEAPVYNIAGKFDLLEFGVLCSEARLFIGNESGPLHIASASGTPLIALFGPGVKDVFYPLGEKVRIHHYFLEKGHTKQTELNSTIRMISIEEVLQSVNELL